MDSPRSAALRADYEHIGLSGQKRIPTGSSLPDREWRAALDRLIAAGLANVVAAEFSLQHPDHARAPLDEETSRSLKIVYRAWLRDDADGADGDQVLYGDLGYWQHWWNRLRAAPSREHAPMRMDAIVGAGFAARPWLAEADPQLTEMVVEQGIVAGRVIVGPTALDSPAEGFVDLLIGERICEVRVLNPGAPFTIYDGVAAVLTETADDDGQERHRLTVRASVVAPLQQLFDLQWSSAIPWEHYRLGSARILHLLARGWTDERIASSLGISTRTLSRRISDAMTASGARTRFELGMRYARSELGG